MRTRETLICPETKEPCERARFCGSRKDLMEGNISFASVTLVALKKLGVDVLDKHCTHAIGKKLHEHRGSSDPTIAALAEVALDTEEQNRSVWLSI